MTLVELLVAIVMGIVAITAAMPMWYFTYRTWTIERIRTNLRINLAMGMEKMKNDIRLSSANYMSYYPSGAGPYNSISFPMAKADQNGLFSLDANGKIDWRKL